MPIHLQQIELAMRLGAKCPLPRRLWERLPTQDGYCKTHGLLGRGHLAPNHLGDDLDVLLLRCLLGVLPS
jgi:hypothetical protein